MLQVWAVQRSVMFSVFMGEGAELLHEPFPRFGVKVGKDKSFPSGIIVKGKFQIYPSNFRYLQIYPAIFHNYKFAHPEYWKSTTSGDNNKGPEWV